MIKVLIVDDDKLARKGINLPASLGKASDGGSRRCAKWQRGVEIFE